MGMTKYFIKQCCVYCVRVKANMAVFNVHLKQLRHHQRTDALEQHNDKTNINAENKQQSNNPFGKLAMF